MSQPTQIDDLVMVIPGIMGSTLVDKDDHLVWSTKGRSLVHAIRTFGGSIKRLTLPMQLDDGHPDDGVRVVGLMQSLHVIPGLWSPITGYDGLTGFLGGKRFAFVSPDARDADAPANLVEFPYDWRLSNRYNGRRLKGVAERALSIWREQPGRADAKLVLLCHSMGGLVARSFLELEGGAEITRALVTIGTPHQGALKALDTLSNGIEKGVGPLKFSLTDMARSFPSMYELLPTYKCLFGVGEGGDRVALDSQDIPGLDSRMHDDAARFHRDIIREEPAPYALHKIVGIRQPTVTTARLSNGTVVPSIDIDDKHPDQGGDGTVPRLAAEPVAGRGSEVHEVADQHGVLQGTRGAQDLIDGLLTRSQVVWQGDESDSFGVDMPEIWAPTDPPALTVTGLDNRLLLVTVLDEANAPVRPPVAVPADGRAVLDPLPPGGYQARVESPVTGGPSPVTRPFLVWDPEESLDG